MRARLLAEVGARGRGASKKDFYRSEIAGLDEQVVPNGIVTRFSKAPSVLE
jgi:hypothetical protein